jgi:hypothetical protein
MRAAGGVSDERLGDEGDMTKVVLRWRCCRGNERYFMSTVPRIGPGRRVPNLK